MAFLVVSMALSSARTFTSSSGLELGGPHGNDVIPLDLGELLRDLLVGGVEILLDFGVLIDPKLGMFLKLLLLLLEKF